MGSVVVACLVVLGLSCSGLSHGSGMALKLPVLRLAFLTSPLHYAHIPSAPRPTCLTLEEVLSTHLGG